MTEKLKVGVLGTGSIGIRHLRILNGQSDIEPIAIPLRPERRPELENQKLITAGDLSEAAKMGCRSLIIATDTSRHVKDAMIALDLGMDLLIEKPMAPTAQDAKAIVDHMKKTGRQVFVGCMLRFCDGLNAFRVRLPELGALHAVRIECRSYLPEWRPDRPYRESYSARASEGGVLRDLIHEVDYAGWLYGWPKALESTLTNTGLLQIESEEIAELSYAVSKGIPRVSIYVDYLTRPKRHGMMASGEKGSLEWDAVAQTVSFSTSSENTVTTPYAQSRNDYFVQEDLAFVRALAGKVDPRLATASDGLKALAVCDAARQSSTTRQEKDVIYDVR